MPNHQQVKLFDKVLKELPELVAVFNHCGFMVSLDNLAIDDHNRPHFSVKLPPETLDLLEMVAANPNTYVHFSGQYAFTHEPYPHNDMKPVAQRLLKILVPTECCGPQIFHGLLSNLGIQSNWRW